MAMLSPADDLKIVWSSVSSARSKHCTLLKKKTSRCFGPISVCQLCKFFFQVARDTKDRVYTWGFGGYGRLGHYQQKDELVPRLVNFFKGKSKYKYSFFGDFSLRERGP